MITDDLTADRQQVLARQFLVVRPRLVRVAYAILGSVSDAEDVVSETWLRLSSADAAEPVRDVEAWGVVAVARAALDEYRSARRRRERYVGSWLPEPVVGAPVSTDPTDEAASGDSVSFALLVVLESLTPAERVAWVLHDLFGLAFAEIAGVVGRTPAAVRQLASRARRRLRDQAPRISVDAREHRTAVAGFLRAASAGDLVGLVAILDPAVVLTSDGGGEVTAARRPVHGAARVARFVLGAASRIRADDRVRTIGINGSTGIGVYRDDDLVGVVALAVLDGRVTRVDIVRAPAKLRRRPEES